MDLADRGRVAEGRDVEASATVLERDEDPFHAPESTP
jgi:hypothetical protein